MVFLQSTSEKKFVQLLLKKLGFQVHSLDKDYNLGDQIIEVLPELLIAANFGQHKASIDVIKKLRDNKKIPKVILIKPPHEDAVQLPEDQQSMIEEVVWSPIEPLKLIEAIASVLKMDVVQLKQKYTNVYGSVATVGNANATTGSSGIIYVGDNEKKEHGYSDVIGKISKPSLLDEQKLIQKLKKTKSKAGEVTPANKDLDKLKREFVVKIFKS